MSLEPPAKFFVNSGLVSSPTDIYNLLRPLLKQTVSYRYLRGQAIVSHGTGWVERIVVDRPEVSTFFTPLSICLNLAQSVAGTRIRRADRQMVAQPERRA